MQWMKRQWPSVAIVSGTIGVVLSYLVWYPTPYERGVTAARHDHAKQRYVIQVAGLPSDSGLLAYDLLEQRYGVGIEGHGCVIDDSLSHYMRGYNDTTKAMLIATHGRDVLKECFDDAERKISRR